MARSVEHIKSIMRQEIADHGYYDEELDDELAIAEDRYLEAGIDEYESER